MPRNIASDVNLAPGCRVFNVDDLKEVVEANKGQRRQAAAEAEVLLRQEQLAFEAWRDSLETVPTIKVGMSASCHACCMQIKPWAVQWCAVCYGLRTVPVFAPHL